MWKTSKMRSVAYSYEKKQGGKQDRPGEWLVDESEAREEWTGLFTACTEIPQAENRQRNARGTGSAARASS